MILGQVVDAATGAPVSEAVVRLNDAQVFRESDNAEGRVMADGDDARFPDWGVGRVTRPH
jgi:hypothetical protein